MGETGLLWDMSFIRTVHIFLIYIVLIGAKFSLEDTAPYYNSHRGLISVNDLIIILMKFCCFFTWLVMFFTPMSFEFLCYVHNIYNTTYTCGTLLCAPHTLKSALENGQEARIVQIDFSAAFDRVNHLGILYKLCSVGIGTERIACILCMHLGACRFFTHPTALMHLKK